MHVASLATLPERLARIGASRKRRRLFLTRVVLAFTGAAFAILVAVAASHLHVGSSDDDAACAVCAAFAEKLHDGPPPTPLVRPLVAVHLVVATLPQPQLIGVAPTLPPPSCGPPTFA
jgi:hypothetical protein